MSETSSAKLKAAFFNN